MESNLTPSSGQDSTTNSQITRSKTNPAWEHISEERCAKWKENSHCLYCKKIAKGGGIHRMKQHLVEVKGDIGPCKSFLLMSDFEWKILCKRDMAEGKEEVQEMQSPMTASSGKRKKSTVDKYFIPRNTQGVQPSMRNVLAEKEAIWRANMAVGRFFYDACISTNVVISTSNQYAKKEVQLLVDSYRAIWAKVGCTIMDDGWTNNRQKTFINFLVYYPKEISFVKSVDASDIVKDATNLFMILMRLISQKHKHINWSPCAAHCLNLIFKDISKMDHVAELVRRASKQNFCTKPIVIGGAMDVIDQKVLKGRLDTMNEMKLFRDRLGSLEETLFILHVKFYNKKRIYDPVDYACIDETNFWIVDEDQTIELDVEELENFLYEEDNEDGGSVAIEGFDVENFGFPDAHFQSSYSNFQNE
ncbi:hypothetical protein CK203_074004 [Vitis vinifera]|uniref:DUF659 domain-containing protein n=1 Tax=Vitis vinifera TaxID=29760 RepID=A0A438DQ29_VITVI|nr:hypothetical protein CK203_074004 [Vitis vinifera]